MTDDAPYNPTRTGTSDPERLLYEAEPDVERERPDPIQDGEAWRRWYRDRLRCRARGADGYRCHWGIREPRKGVCTTCREEGRPEEDWTKSPAHVPQKPARRARSLDDDEEPRHEPFALEAHELPEGAECIVHGDPDMSPESRKALGEVAAVAYARLTGPKSPPEAPASTPGTGEPPRSGETGAPPASRGTPLSRARAKAPQVDASRVFGEHAAQGATVPDLDALEAQLGQRGQSFDIGDTHVETTLHRIRVPELPARRRGSSLDDLGPRALRDDEKLPGTCQLSNKGCPRYYTMPRVRPPGDDLPERQEPKGGPACCPHGQCWYDAQLDRRARRLPAVTPEAWAGILRGEIDGT